MNEQYWQQLGFSADPFPLETDGLCFESEQWQRYIEFLQELDHYRKALLLVMGEAYCGKTTLLQQFVYRLPDTITCIQTIGEERFGAESISQLLAGQLDDEESMDNDTSDIHALVDYQLSQLQATGRQYILIIDQAEQLPPDALYLCLYLVKQQIVSNHTCLQVVLFGQNVLLNDFEKIFQKHHETINSYVVNKLIVEPFDRIDTIDYINFRLDSVEMEDNVFDDDELQLIYERSHGIAGHINRVARQILQSKSPKSSKFPALGAVSKQLFTRLRWWLGCLAIIIILLFWVLPMLQNHGQNRLEENLPLPQSPQQQQQSLANQQQQQEQQAALHQQMLAQQQSQQQAVVHKQENHQSIVIPKVSKKPMIATSEFESHVKAMPVKHSQLQKAHHKPEKMVKLVVNGEIKTVPASSLQPHHVLSKPSHHVVNNTASVSHVSLSASDKRLLKVNKHMYTLQLIALRSQTDAIEFVNAHNIASIAGVYAAKRHGKLVYLVILGYFPNRQAAVTAIPDLDPALAKLKPWPRTYASVHKDILGR